LPGNVYDFERQRELGAIGESIIRGVFAQQFNIQRSVALEQRQGIDFWFSYGAFDLAVEVKTDFTAAHTRNAFIEVTSVDVDGKPGWAHTSRADFLLYYVPPDRVVYVVAMREIRHRLPAWRKKYESRRVQNDGYQTEGILVPLDQLNGRVLPVLGAAAESLRMRDHGSTA
jgi:hypothetical protein